MRRSLIAAVVSVSVALIGVEPAWAASHPAGQGEMTDAQRRALSQQLHPGQSDVPLLPTTPVLGSSASAAQALASADLALGVMPTSEHADTPPPFYADLLLADLAGAWQVLRALPAARTATERGVAISIGASSIAGLLLVRGVRATIPGVGAGQSRGPGPVTVGAGAGMLSGYLLARRVLRGERVTY